MKVETCTARDVYEFVISKNKDFWFEKTTLKHMCNGAAFRSDAKAGAGEARRIARFHG